MIRRIRWTTVAVVVGIAFVIWMTIGIILAGRNEPPPPSGSVPLTLHGGRVTGNRISTRSWTFDYRSAQMSPDGTIATVDGVHHGLLYKKGKPYLSISAEHVSVNTQTFDFTATGDVHIESMPAGTPQTKAFDSDLVQWSNATKMLSLPHPSLIRSGDQTLKVASISVDFNKNEIHMGAISGGFHAGP